MASEAIVVKAVYGAYRVVKTSGKKYMCRCVTCRDKQELTPAKLLKHPECPACAANEGGEDKAQAELGNYLVKLRNTMEKEGEINEDALDSLFGKDSEKIMSLISSAEEKDRGFSLFQVRMLMTLVDMIPLAEQRVRNQEASQSSVYGLNAMINSVRELINDMQANQEQSNLAGNIVEKVIFPIFSSFAHMYVTQANNLKLAIHPHVKDNRYSKVEEAVMTTFKEIGGQTEVLYAKVFDDLRAFLE